MICTPTNAYPNNDCVDGSDYIIRITFNGDACMGADFFIYDFKTEKQLKHLYDRGEYSNGFYNGEEINIKYGNSVSNDGEYLWQAVFYEKVDLSNGYYPTILGNSGKTRDVPYHAITVIDKLKDVKYKDTEIQVTKKASGLKAYHKMNVSVYWEGNGRAIANYDWTKGILNFYSSTDNFNGDSDETVLPPVGTTLYISMDKFNSIDEILKCDYLVPIARGLSIDTGTHALNSNGTGKAPNSYLMVNGKYYGITKYFYKTGMVALDSDCGTVDSGTPYSIYQCYVKSPYYYYTTKAIPAVTPSMEFTEEVIKCTATINNQGQYPLKYFYWTIKDENGNIVNQSEKIYSSRMEYLFREVQTGHTYKGCITIVTQTNVVVTSDYAECTVPNGGKAITELKAEVGTIKNGIKLTWKLADGVSPTSYMFLRKDDRGNVKYLETKSYGENDTKLYSDYSCRSGTEYEYIVIPKTKTTVYEEATVKVKSKFDCWTIYFLKQVPYSRPDTSITDVRIYYNYMYGDKQFSVTDVWKVQISPEIDDIEHNIQRDIDDSYMGKPMITYGNMNYDSFTLSFELGNLSCPSRDLIGTDYRTFETWKADINSQAPVMIKDPIGNIWVGAITEHTYTPDYAGHNYQLYKIKIKFVQTQDMNKTRIKSV